MVADELYKQTNGNFVFVEIMPMPFWIKKSGYPVFSGKPYLLQAWKNDDSKKCAWQLAIDADVALFSGFEVLDFERYRISLTNKITFDVSERWLKRGLINMLSPRILKLYYAYKKDKWKNKRVFKLCASAYAAEDHHRLNMYRDKCFKWGYFTQVNLENFNVMASDSTSMKYFASNKPVRLMWCARFLWWKHPELPIKLAASLQRKGYSFHIDMFGTGEKLEKMKALAALPPAPNVPDWIVAQREDINADMLAKLGVEYNPEEDEEADSLEEDEVEQ